jgi:hypothetical protein
MASETIPDEASVKTDHGRRGRRRRSRDNKPTAGGGAVYGLGMIGALVFFLQAARSDRERLLAFPMAMVWPAILVYRLFRSLAG